LPLSFNKLFLNEKLDFSLPLFPCKHWEDFNFHSLGIFHQSLNMSLELPCFNKKTIIGKRNWNPLPFGRAKKPKRIEN